MTAETLLRVLHLRDHFPIGRFLFAFEVEFGWHALKWKELALKFYDTTELSLDS